MHPVESSPTIKSLSREFSYTQVTVERVQLQNKLLYYIILYFIIVQDLKIEYKSTL